MSELYKCSKCGNICTENEMEVDFIEYFDNEGNVIDSVECYHVCPACGEWYNSINLWIKING